MWELDFYFLRIIAAFLCGAMICLSGSLTQHASQNSLAGPSTLGFDGVAVICVLLAQFAKLLFVSDIRIELLGILFFIPVLAFLLFFSKTFGKSLVKKLDIKAFVLIGLCFNLFVGAIFSVIQFLFMALNLEFPSGLWFGNFRFMDTTLFLAVLMGFVLIYFLSFQIMRKLRVLSLGEGIVQNLAVDGEKVQRQALLISLTSTVICVNLFGVFSFLSLIFPLSVRSLPFFKSHLKREILIGSLLSGVFLSVIDFLCYNYPFQGIEFPVGMMSSVLGAFVLMALLLNEARLKKRN